MSGAWFMLTRNLVCVMTVAVLLVGCGQSEPSPSTTGSIPGTAEGSTVAEDPATTQAPNTTQPPSPDSTEPSIPADPYLEGLDLDLIVLDNPAGNPRPTLSWEGLDEAAYYTVMVLDPDGTPWWAWSGDGTRVVLGGVDTTTEIGGPRATPGATWVVFAFDSNGALVGASPQKDLGG